MRPVKRYALLQSTSEDSASKLMHEGNTLETEVEGRVLEAQFELAGGDILIWLTDDSPYDEGLHVYLLDEDARIVDGVEAGADFTPGLLRILEIGENHVDFQFFTNDVVYRLEVTKEPGLRFLLPPGWRYRKRLGFHRLKVSELGRVMTDG